jgi:hypothetical protein
MANTVGQPDGSSASSLNPPGPAPASAWELVKEWDWTDSGSHTFVDDTNQSFGGVNWKSNNTPFADSGSPDVSGDGLKFVITGSATSSSRWWGPEQTGPVVSADLDDILSGYSLADTLSIQALCDFDVDDDGTHDGVFNAGLVIFSGALGVSGAGLWHYLSWWRESTVAGDKYQSRYGGGTPQNEGNNYDSAAGKPSFLELTAFPGTGWAASGSLDTSYQEPMSVTTFRSYGNMELQLPKNMGSGGTTNPGPNPAFTLRPDNMRIGMWASYLSDLPGWTRDSKITCKFTGLRVMKRI